MAKQQFGIKCPKTGKNLTVSRDVYNALQHAQQDAKRQQSSIQSKLEKSGQALVKKQYVGSTKDLVVAIKFDEDGKIEPKVDFRNSLEYLDEKTRRIAEDVLYQFTICLNQTVTSKSDDMKEQLKRTVQPAA